MAEREVFLMKPKHHSFIPVRRMNFWCPVIKRKKIIVWVHVYPCWKTKINPKIGRKISFPCETKAPIPFIPISRMCFWCPIMKRMEIITWIHDYPYWQMNFDSKKGAKWSFSYKRKASIGLSQQGKCIYGA